MKYVTGVHAIEEHLKLKASEKILFVAGSARKNREIIDKAKTLGVKVTFTEIGELDRMVPKQKHRGLVLRIRDQKSSKKPSDLKQFLKGPTPDKSLVLILDSIQDPHNFGAIIRSADQFAVDCIIVPERRSVKETPTVSRVSSGADAFTTLFVVPNLNRAIDLLKQHDYWIYGADMDGESVHKVSFDAKNVLVLGSEGKGLRRLTKEHCDQLVGIPIRGHVDSFNVSVAAGILMYEIRRKQDYWA